MSDRRTHTIVLAPPAARVAAGGSTAFEVSRFTEALLFIDVKVVSGASPTLDFEVQTGPADDEVAFVHTRPEQITSAGKTLVMLVNIGSWLRLAWSVGGEGSSFTFEARLALKT
ncbi:MAG: hypothetical protein OXE44_12295 [Nitrospinae bacterium]|nr:hypothetical protein [Nitrospinota bacterium]